MAGRGGGGLNPKEDDSDWKFEVISIIYHIRGTNLAYEMLCEPINSDNK